jgi:AcrR family transcriptional regulator
MNGIVQNVYDFVSEMTPPQLLPSPAPARLRRDEVAASQRGRMLRAMAEAASDRGYVNTVVSDVVARAGVSRKTFYEHFGDKEECFLASYDAGVESLVDVIEEKIRGEHAARVEIDAMIDAYLRALAAEPEWAKTYLVEVFAIGPAALERRRAGLERFAGIVRELHKRLLADGEDVRPLDAVDHEALVGGVAMLVTMQVAAGRAARLPRLRRRIIAYLMGAVERG